MSYVIIDFGSVLSKDCETALNLISGLAGALGKHKYALLLFQGCEQLWQDLIRRFLFSFLPATRKDV